MTGEVEDTDVGFPGPEHHIAEREFPMKVAMGALAVLAIVGGFLQIPGVNEGLHHFLEPTFARLGALRGARAVRRRRRGSGWSSARVIGARRHLHRLHAVGAAARAAERDPGALRARCTRFFVNKWYFDEAIDFLVVRPVGLARALRATRTFERVFVNGALVGGTTGVVRLAVGRRARGADRLPALLRRAAAGRASPALGAYFLISA